MTDDFANQVNPIILDALDLFEAVRKGRRFEQVFQEDRPRLKGELGRLATGKDDEELARRALVYWIDEILVSGGGVFNHTLMRALVERFDPIPVRNLGEVSEISPESKEAVAFAILANEAIHGHAAGLPAVTGASRPVVLGKLIV